MIKQKYEKMLNRELDDYIFEKAIEICDQILATRESMNMPTSDEGVERLIKTAIILIEHGVEIVP